MVRSESFALLMWEFRPREVRQLAKVTEEIVAGPSEARFDVTALRPPSLPGLPLNASVLSERQCTLPDSHALPSYRLELLSEEIHNPR